MSFDTLPPWDANRWFQLPVYTETAATGVNPQRVLDANPMRVGLWFSFAPVGAGITSVAPSPDLGPNGGFQVNNSTGAFQLTHKDWAILCQSEWFVNASAGQVITTVELLLRDWPEPDPHRNVDVKDYLAEIAEFIRSLRVNGNVPRG